MSNQITVTLPEDVIRRAELLARRVGRPVADVLAEVIELSLRPLGALPNGDRPVTAWPDDEVLAAAEGEMPDVEDARLSELLNRQQAGRLTDSERSELAALMQLYQAGLLHKAQALREAVRRGLREPVQP
jgi:hypothetical protein